MAGCHECGEANPEGARFCSGCGVRLSRAPESEERKTVSVLFCDLVGFTARSDHADPEDVRGMLRPYHAMLRTVLTRFGGTVEKFIGDAVMAVFGAPVSHEDDAERAARAALAILAAVRELNLSRTGTDPLAVRVGISSGEVLVALGARPVVGEGMVFGDPVNTAARLQTLAPADGIVMDAATCRLTQHVIDTRRLSPVMVKGKTDPLDVWQVIGTHDPPDSSPDRMTPLVGRSTELQLLRTTLNEVKRNRCCRLVTIIGQPGVGKSRLVAELIAAVTTAGEPVTWRRGQCPAYGEGVTFWALGQILKTHAGILDTDHRDTAQAKLSRAVGAVVDETNDATWIATMLAPLVGLTTGDRGAVREETFTGWRRFFEALARTQPVVLVVEDLHWADAAMLEFLDYLRATSTGVPLLLVCTTRPELAERNPSWGGGEAAASGRLSLSTLNPRQTAQLIGALLGAAALPAETQALLLEKSGGNPLYAEQFVRLLTDTGGLRFHGRAVTVNATQPVPIPATIEALIAARLDTLDRQDKALLQAAAVVGEVFWSGAVAAATSNTESDVRQRLDDLTRREFLHAAEPSGVIGQAEYRFWHELFRDVSYKQIPRTARGVQHQLIAGWWEDVTADRIADHAEVLAHHYGQALTLATATGTDPADQLIVAARRFLVLAGDRATHLDPTVAETHYRRALELLPTGHPEWPEVGRRAACAAAAAGHIDAAVAGYRQSINANLRGGNPRAAGNATVELANLMWDRGDTASARALANEAFELLADKEPCAELAYALGFLAFQAWTAGRPEQAVTWAAQVIDVAEATALDEVRGLGLMERGQARLDLDDPEGISDIRAAVLATQRALDRGWATIRGSWQLLYWHANLVEALWLVEGTAPALEAASAAEELAVRRGLLHPLTAVRADGLRVLYDAGRWDDLLRTARKVITQRADSNGDYSSTVADIYIANVLLHRGQLAAAAGVVDRLTPQARTIGDLQVLGPALEVAATLSMAQGHTRNALATVRELADATVNAPARRARHLGPLTRICAAAGDLSLAKQLINGTDLHLRRHACAHQAALATIAEARSDLQTAIGSYDRAASSWRDYGHPLEQAHALLGFARCAHPQDEPRAAAAQHTARTLFTSLRAQPLTARGPGNARDADRVMVL